MKVSKLAILLLAGSLYAGSDRDWKTGKVNRVMIVPYRVPGVNLGEGVGYSPPQILQWIRIAGNDDFFNVSYVVTWHTPKVRITGAIQYALDTDGNFYIKDEDNREFKVKLVDRDPVPPPARKDRDWKTGRVTFAVSLPFMNGGGNYANMPGALPRDREWIQIEGENDIFNLNYLPSWHPPEVTVNGPIQYAMESGGRFYVQDDHHREFEVTMVNKGPLPPLADSSPPPSMMGHASAPRTLFDRDGVEVVAVETEKTIDFTVDTPENVHVRVLADRDQNGQIDRLVDTGYGLVHGRPRLCTQYLIDERTSTFCGGLQSAARLSQFTVGQGRRKYVLSIPKEELSAGLDSASFVLRFGNTNTHTWTSYPSPSFQRALHWQYTVHAGRAGAPSPS